MSISLKKSGMLKLGLSLVAMTVAASVQAKTLVYCSEGSRKALTHSSLPLVRLTTQALYRSITVWLNSKPAPRK